MRHIALPAQGTSAGARGPTTLSLVSDAPRGKRGTVRLDPSSTVPEAIPAIRFADPGELDAEAERRRDPRRKNDRKEFAQAVVPKGFRPTVEMGSVDVSRADPRKAPTQEVSRLPLVDRGYDPSYEDGPPAVAPPSSGHGWKIGVGLAVAGAIVAAYILLRGAI